MNDDLLKKYDFLFPAKEGSIEPIRLFGIECSKGWEFLLDNVFTLLSSNYRQAMWNLERAEVNSKDSVGLIAKLREDLEKIKSELPVICQVKSKFATLRIYGDNLSKYHNGVISMAEMMSAGICEFCGNKGQSTGKRWITTLCPECMDKKE